MDRYAAEPRQVFHALTQVCRQLRTEFHPLYIMRNTVLIRHYHLEMYLGFLNKHKTDDSLGGQHANFVGNIAVAMHPHPEAAQQIFFRYSQSIRALRTCAYAAAPTVMGPS
jgi:hypothetical protein